MFAKAGDERTEQRPSPRRFGTRLWQADIGNPTLQVRAASEGTPSSSERANAQLRQPRVHFSLSYLRTKEEHEWEE